MAKQAKAGTLTLYVETGMNPDGSAKTSARSIGRINPELTDANAYAFAAGVANLQQYALADVMRIEKSIITA